MTNATEGKIFLSDERGLSQSSWFRSSHTFNFGKYFNEHKKAFGDIYVVNDDALDAGRSLVMLIEEPSYIIILPVMGAVTYKDASGNTKTIVAGQVQIALLNRNESIAITNPFNEGIVNFLQIWIRARDTKGQSRDTSYDVNAQINKLIDISALIKPATFPFGISIGKFDGRNEATYQIGNNRNGVFVFVIEGVFEIEGRLVHARDSLALWNVELIDMEALSNGSIILLIELNNPQGENCENIRRLPVD